MTNFKDKLKKFLFLMRKETIIGVSISMYILSVYYFFFNPKLIWALIFSILFFSFAHFFIIEIKKTNINNLLLFMVFITVVVSFFIGTENILYLIGFLVFNIAVFFLFLDIYEEVYNRIEINSYKVFTMGVKLYSLLLSAVFAISFLGTYRSFNLTCNQIYDNMKKISNYTLKYFKTELPNFENKKIKDIIKIEHKQTNLSGTNLSGTNITENNFNGIQSIKLTDIFSIKFWKNIVINQIVENKKILDKGLCETIVQNIKEKYNKPQFQFTVMFLIFLLFYPIIRIILYILAIINLISFKILNLMKIYKFKTVVEDVEVIE